MSDCYVHGHGGIAAAPRLALMRAERDTGGVRGRGTAPMQLRLQADGYSLDGAAASSDAYRDVLQ